MNPMILIPLSVAASFGVALFLATRLIAGGRGGLVAALAGVLIVASVLALALPEGMRLWAALFTLPGALGFLTGPVLANRAQRRG